MSGKAARKLRRLAEQMTNGLKGDTTVHDGIGQRAYKSHKVASSKKPSDWNDRGPVAEVIRLSPQSTRAFYQEAKKQMKNGVGEIEANRIEKEYRQDQKQAAKKLAKDLEAKVEARHQPKVDVDQVKPVLVDEPFVFPEQDKNIDPMHWLDEFTGWAMKEDNRLVNVLPLQILISHSSPEAGYLTVTGLESKTEQGLMFVISSAGYIRTLTGKVIQLQNPADQEALYKEVFKALTDTMRHYKEIKIMEVCDVV